jgi:hypothetical protein
MFHGICGFTHEGSFFERMFGTTAMQAQILGDTMIYASYLGV